MTVAEFEDWLEENEVSLEAELVFYDRTWGCWEEIDPVVHGDRVLL